ncbi:MAG: NAD(P)-dependent alcohol dehydrogenase [Candidatus Thorarchaeota archaeon]|nr:MAG: NAD(P)-dependent alcohol dehydrogenase [Candidatus Thorarchaeota archaeon]
MKAIVIPKYGGPEVLQYKDVERPSPTDGEVLVKVYASSLNAADFEAMRGSWATRIGGPRRTKQKILGTDIAGVVEEVGRNIKEFQPGDEVLADLLFPGGYCAFAEYVCAPEKVLAAKSASMTFEQAATLPHSGLVALQGLREKRQVQPGDRVLINGAGGGMGTFAVQIAKYYGAEVTGVDSEMKLDMVRSLGADHVIDYRKEDCTRSEARYDIILDMVARRSILDYRRVMSPNGIYQLIGGSRYAIFQAFVLGPLISRMGKKKLGINIWKQHKREDYEFLAQLFDSGDVVPVIDKRVPLSEVPEALSYLEKGLALGKVVITMANQ